MKGSSEYQQMNYKSDVCVKNPLKMEYDCLAYCKQRLYMLFVKAISHKH